MVDLAAHLGVSYQQVQKYETGQNRIGAAKLSAIAKFLGCSIEDLVPPHLATQDGQGDSVEASGAGKGPALQRALTKPDVVHAALLFDRIQTVSQRAAALAVLEGLGRVPAGLTPSPSTNPGEGP